MFDAIFTNALLLKKIFNSLTDVLKEVTLDCTEGAIEVMGMDTSHVALVQLLIKADTEGPVFSAYRCDKPMPLSFKIDIMNKILKCCSNDDSVQLIVEEDNKAICQVIVRSKEVEKDGNGADVPVHVKKFNVNLIELENDALGVPDDDYPCEVQMPSQEFSTLMKNLSIHGETLALSLDKSSLNLSVKGDDASAEFIVKPRRPRAEREAEEEMRKVEDAAKNAKTEKTEEADEDIAEKEESEEKAPENKTPEPVADGEAPAEEETAEGEGEPEGDVDMEEEEGESLTAVKQEKPKKASKKKAPKEPKEEKEKEGEDPNLSRVAFAVSEPVSVTYSLRYMTMFAKAAPLANYVKLSVSDEQPVVVKFPLEDEGRGHLSFYLAPKIDE